MRFRSGRAENGGFLRFRCSRTLSTLRSGSRNPPFSARPDLNLNRPLPTEFRTPVKTAISAWTPGIFRVMRPATRRFGQKPVLWRCVARKTIFQLD
ncbi:hypothetical protein EN809_025255 [Mesorhizobium sp. M2E.F.Ca.ET.166.01.1.1]|nr:hypothetical protein EN862_013990 [Mesorhizobium sp. M2E.F.Ca.ET.219.01.1.1]TGS10735.1 hypothetical protein EN852_024920 [Mesorhizobium sp. M2E.F.Ca.ET.209.01.1.1]TGT67847.1 hypothetical protein EN809_025255 [Mesorhizobium sp. M2E.F.Ca.ET.166.01.1.1]TGW00848.1 hypothetical protein EN797_010565 [Mesorhizobium sp. M2E.F.Ca.ET.154.01.1.1]